ncbi:MAG: serine hydrolase domain-containing protein [Acidobacteriota bacterium]|nr:serine hydrolase domain-containing protein [Acidobacteriota bacterium]
MSSILIFVAFSPSFGGTAELEAWFEEQFQANAIPGLAVVVVKDDRVVFLRGFGKARASGNTPITADTVMPLGSISKSFTALALLRLAETGQLDLDRPVTAYLPWFTTARKAKSDLITTRLLLSNTSGLPSLDLGILGIDLDDDADERLVRNLSGYMLNREPGLSFEYCNEGFTVAGLVGTTLYGKPYAAFMEETVFEPLGMTRTTADFRRFRELDSPDGHYPGIEAAIPAEHTLLTNAYAAAGMIRAGARDMGRYMRMLLAGGVLDGKRFVSEESVGQLWRHHIALPEREHQKDNAYCLGWQSNLVDQRRLITHGGNTSTASAFLAMEPDRKTGVALLSVIDSLDPRRFASLERLANNALHILHDEPLSDFGLPTQPDITINDYTLPKAEFAAYTGNYLSAGLSTHMLTVSRSEDGGLEAKAVHRGALERHGLLDFANPSRSWLRTIGPPRPVIFNRTLDGRVYALTYQGDTLYKQATETADKTQTSPDARLRLRLPPGWELNWTDGGFDVTHRTRNDLILKARFLSLGEDDTLEKAIEVMIRQPVAFRGEVHTQTIDGRTWRQQSLVTAGNSKQAALWVTRCTDDDLVLLLSTTRQDLTILHQETLFPILKQLSVSD